MALTMREFLQKMGFAAGIEKGIQEGIEKGIRKGREEGLEEGTRRALERALASLRKALRRRGVAPKRYEHELTGLTDPGKVVDLVASFMAAKDPAAYLRRRFGH